VAESVECTAGENIKGQNSVQIRDRPLFLKTHDDQAKVLPSSKTNRKAMEKCPHRGRLEQRENGGRNKGMRGFVLR